AVLPGLRLARETRGPVETKVEQGDHPLTDPIVGYVARDVKPGRAPGRTPCVADPDWREGTSTRLGAGGGLAPHAKARQLGSGTRDGLLMKSSARYQSFQ